MSCSYHQLDLPEPDIPLHGYSSEFVSKAMARLVQPIDPDDPEGQPAADLTVKCGSLDVETHGHILCRDSAYFKVICKGGFLEEYTQELHLPAEEEFLIRRLLSYCYTTGYDDAPYEDEIDPPPHIQAPAYVNRLHLNAQMYGAADKYDLSGLKEKAAWKFDMVIEEMHADRIMNLHRRTGAGVVDQIFDAIPCIYGSTPDGDRRLRDRAVEVLGREWRGVRDHSGLKDLIVAVPELLEERVIRWIFSLPLGIIQSSRLTPRVAHLS